MRLLECIGRNQDFIELEELPVVGNAPFLPSHQDDVQRLFADGAPAVEVHVPAQEFMIGNAGAGPEFHPAA